MTAPAANARLFSRRVPVMSPWRSGWSVCITVGAARQSSSAEPRPGPGDLKLARLDAQRRTDVALTRGEPATALGLEFRYALMAASVDAHVPGELVSALSAAGVWDAARMRAHPGPHPQAAAGTEAVPAGSGQDAAEPAAGEMSAEQRRAVLLAAIAAVFLLARHFSVISLKKKHTQARTRRRAKPERAAQAKPVNAPPRRSR
jgi:hypothetical protein